MSTAAIRQNEKIADDVMDGIRGQTLGKSFAEEARREILDPDSLFALIRQLEANQSSAHFRGFCRALQKHVERA